MYLFGASGHGQVVLEIAEDKGHLVEAFIDMDLNKKELLNIPVLHEIPKQMINVIIAIGNNTIRKRIVISNKTFRYPTLVHSRANISHRTELGSGTVVMAGATINSNVNIGEQCIINTNASVDHDCLLGDFVHISPQVGLAGNVSVGEGTHVGIGATVIQNIKIGKWVTIGAGAVIIHDVPDFAVVVGNPGKIIKYRN
ncbi:acetyltransferase [Pedobacter sp. MC2016-05]|uniref:acetyltransferase n=1 Tax=Pedobacter sp. MC2016-05 TaxID=2994474 RepID=UPI00224748C1|nr:acetyltransferase [Pedobacter sp. MC2016-05]MCX2473192.1 acetyltransferase [Pedobacter sp. MC2016-05]